MRRCSSPGGRSGWSMRSSAGSRQRCASLAEAHRLDADGRADAPAAGGADDVRSQGCRLARRGRARAGRGSTSFAAASGPARRSSRDARCARSARAAGGGAASPSSSSLGRAGCLPWHADRSIIAELGAALALAAGACAKIGYDIALLEQTEVAEVREPAGRGRLLDDAAQAQSGRLGARRCVLSVASARPRRFFRRPRRRARAGARVPGRRSGGRSPTRSRTPAAPLRAFAASLDGLEIDAGRMRANLGATAGR